MTRRRNRAEIDRLHGQGLPAGLDDTALLRLAHRRTPNNTIRVASRLQALAQGFSPIANAPDLYKRAHDVWALRPAEEGPGFVLIRLCEEPSVDMVRNAQQLDPADLRDAHEVLHGREPIEDGGPLTEGVQDLEEAEYEIGDRVAMLHRGQLADAMVVFINPSEALADLMMAGTGEHVRDVPMEHLMPCGCGDAEVDDSPESVVIELVSTLAGDGEEDPFEPLMEASSKRSAADDTYSYESGHSFSQETDIDTMVEVTQAFRPILYSGQIALPADRVFEVAGYTPGTDEETDAMGGVDVPNPLYPEEDDDPAQFVRIRLKDSDTGVEVYVLPLEFERFLSARGQFPKPLVRHRSKTPPPAKEDLSDVSGLQSLPEEKPRETSRDVTRTDRPPSES